MKNGANDLDNDIKSFKHLITSDIIVDHDAVIEMSERLINQATKYNNNEIDKINSIKQVLFKKSL